MTLVGRLGAEPEVTTAPSGQTLVKYVIATSYGPKDKRQTSWFRVAAFPAQGTGQEEFLKGLEKG
jgi:single-stranded DNA-binding protein